jgi:hypothetical protein
MAPALWICLLTRFFEACDTSALVLPATRFTATALQQNNGNATAQGLRLFLIAADI